MTWDDYFLTLAKTVAIKSKDPSTKVGAVLVDEFNRVVSIGFNGFPRKVHDEARFYENRTHKWMRTVHAEANALLFADRKGETMYISQPPCAQCMAWMIQHGVSRVIYWWSKEISYKKEHKEAQHLAAEAGINLYEVRDPSAE